MRGRTLEQKAYWIYRIASLVATLEAFCLFILGLDLTLGLSCIWSPVRG
jgi:hypothetical protein